MILESHSSKNCVFIRCIFSRMSSGCVSVEKDGAAVNTLKTFKFGQSNSRLPSPTSSNSGSSTWPRTLAGKHLQSLRLMTKKEEVAVPPVMTPVAQPKPVAVPFPFR